MGNNLVLARVGSRSLHNEWLGNGGSRGWDLRLIPYEPVGRQQPEVMVDPVLVGPKWSGVTEVLSVWDGWCDYD
jgi:hypothetical protein